MNVNFEKLDNVHGQLTVTIEEKDYADKIKKQLKEISRHRPEPGFRPGHTPEGLLRKKYGDSVKYDVINQAVGDAVYDYIRENNLHVLGNPMPEADNKFDIKDSEFTMKFKLGIAPEINTHLDKNLHIPFYTIKVADEMIEKQDNALRRRFGKQVPGEVADATCLVKGEMTELNEDGSVKEDGIKVENGIISVEYFADPEQKKLFEEKHPGDTVRFNPAATCNGNPAELSSMLNIDKEETDAHHGDFNMEIKEIIVLKPAEHDQEFFDGVFGKDKVHNEEEFKKALSDMIALQLTADSNYRFTIDAKDALLKAQGDMELPDDVLKAFLQQQNEALNNENIDEEYVKIRPQLVWELLREAVASQLDIKIDEEELKDSARRFTAQQLMQYGMSQMPDELLDKYADNFLKDAKMREQIYNFTVDSKLYAGIKEAAEIDNKEVDVEEFNALFTAPEANAAE